MLSVLLFGVFPTYLLLTAKGWIWWLGYAALLFAYFHQRRTAGYVAAATNLVAARVTFEKLDKAQQAEVDKVSRRVITACGGSASPEFRNQAQMFGWYALGMRELGIRPAVLLSQWNIVKNPFIVPARRWIDSAIHIAQEKHGISVEVDDGGSVY